MSEVAAGTADLRADVAGFREDVLRRRKLTPQEVCELLDSPAAAFCAPKWFGGWETPL